MKPRYEYVHESPDTLMTARLVCFDCGVVVQQETKGIHDKWHTSIDERIAAAAQVGAHGDMMTRVIGGGSV